MTAIPRDNGIICHKGWEKFDWSVAVADYYFVECFSRVSNAFVFARGDIEIGNRSILFFGVLLVVFWFLEDINLMARQLV
ncbi:MAG TPA: hypothetical protein DIT95_09140 [Arenibacter sp.]|nr:hypothetical protein [Arenibacter sp.]